MRAITEIELDAIRYRIIRSRVIHQGNLSELKLDLCKNEKDFDAVVDETISLVQLKRLVEV